MQKFSKNPQFIKDLFNSISKDYDKLNDIMTLGIHRKIKKNIVKHLTFVSDAPSFLDICTGTGDIAAILRKFYPKAKIIGIDFSDKMVEIAKEKNVDVDFLKADCSELSFENESFDLCTVSFGLRNVENLEVVLKEIYRVLKPGGIFINLDLGKPNCFFNFFLKPYMYIWVAFLGKIFHGDKFPYEYLAASNETFPSPKELVEIYKKIGFSNIKNKNYLFGQTASQICRKNMHQNVKTSGDTTKPPLA